MRLHYLLPVILTAAFLMPKEASAFPEDGQWIPVMLNGAPLSDIRGDASNGRSDIVGNAENPAGFFFQDTRGLFLRMRLDADPHAGTTNLHPQGAWGVALEYDGDFNSLDAIVWRDGNKPATVHLRANTVSEGRGACDIAETPVASSPAAEWSRLAPAGTNFGGTADFFLDFFIPSAELEKLPPGPQGQLPLSGTPTRFVFGTAKSSGVYGFDDDIAGSDVTPLECTLAAYLDVVSDDPADNPYTGGDGTTPIGPGTGHGDTTVPPNERPVIVSDTEEEAVKMLRESKVECLWVPDPDHKGAGVSYVCEPSTLGGGAMGCAAGGGAGGREAGILVILLTLLFAMRKRSGALLLLAFFLLTPGTLWAMDTERYRISPSPTGWSAVDQYDVVDAGDMSAGFFIGFAKDPVVYRDGTRITRRVVSGRLTGDLVGAFGVYKRVEIGLAVPAVLYQTGEGFLPADLAVPPAISLGDLRLRPKIALLTPAETGADWGLAIVPALHLPTSREGALAGSEGLSFHPELVGGGRAGDWAFAGNVGAGLRRETREWGVTEGHSLFYRAAAAWQLPSDWGREKGFTVTGELLGETAASRPFSQAGKNPLELMAGAMGNIQPGLSWHGGAGAGLLPGIGSPTFRMIAGLRWSMSGADSEMANRTGPFAGAQRATREIEERNRQRSLATVRDGRIELGRTVTFLTGQDIISPESYELLDAVTEVLRKERKLKVRIVGHTDNVGDPALNQPLSLRRAESVSKYLVEKGIDGKRLRVEGRGQTEPVASNATPEGREKNRRVEFLVEK
jgi:outer membrane protein OmpA-like peptidoglycan-associated protein